MTDVIEKIREGNSDQSVEFFDNLITEVKDSQKDIEIPERDNLYTDSVHLEDEPDGNIWINGQNVHPVYARLVNQINAGLTPIVVIVGKEGYGKSMTAVRLVYELSEKLNVLRSPFNVENQVVYRPLEFLFLERESTRTGEIFEEANETLNSSDYHSVFNQAVAGSIRTQRKRENMKVFVCPELQKLDLRIRDKVDVVIDMKGKQFAEVTTYQKKHAKRSSRGLDYYYNGDYPYWSVPDVPEEYQERYDKLDNQFKGEYLDELIIRVLRERLDEVQDDQTAQI